MGTHSNLQVGTCAKGTLTRTCDDHYLDATVVLNVLIGGADLSLHLRGESIVLIFAAESQEKDSGGSR